MLHTLHALLGDDGWWKGIRAYVRRFAGQTVTTADFENALEQATGASLAAVFDGYVYSAGIPQLR